MNNLVNVEKAGINDIDALVKMRLEPALFLMFIPVRITDTEDMQG